MTGKEALRHFVDDLTEEEASAWLERMCHDRSLPPPSDFEQSLGQPRLSHRTDREAALALVRIWRSEGPVMTEGEWDEFARAVDEERPERPLFA